MSLLTPTSVAVIGASSEEHKVGHYILKNIITQGYQGAVYPINPKGGEILGKTAYPTITDVPGPIDLAVIVTPAKTVLGLAEECGKKGVKTLVVISAGFGEIGTEDGHAMEAALVDMVRKYGISLVGPNCLGVIRPSIGLNASFAENLQGSGSVALLSQSGAMAVALLDAAAAYHVGFSLVVSMGNKSAQDECDFLELAKNDPETKVIGMYLESINNGKRFLEIAREVCRTKPIVLIKSGTSSRGQRAVSSHTGALAGSDAAIDAVCAQTGIRRAQTAERFMDMIQVLSSQPPLLSQNIAVITNAGGPGILATDAAEREGLMLVSLEGGNRDALKSQLPPAASAQNPVDVLGDAADDRYLTAINACARDPNIDGLVVVLTPQVMTPEDAVAKTIVETMKSRPLMPIATAFMGNKNVMSAREILQSHGIPNYPTPERAVAALSSLRPVHVLQSGSTAPTSHVTKAGVLLQGQTGLLSEDLTAELFRLYELPLPSAGVAKTADEAVALAESMGYPVVAKISSPQIIHKTDIGGVRTNIRSADDLRKAFAEIMANAKAHAPTAELQGILIQQFLPAGSEFIVGATKDPSFGHLVMVGLGGIYTELFRDTAFRIAPVSEADAYQMLRTLKSWKLLMGLRGAETADVAKLADVLTKISALVTDCPQIVELDLNPVLVWSNRVTVADAKIVIA